MAVEMEREGELGGTGMEVLWRMMQKSEKCLWVILNCDYAMMKIKCGWSRRTFTYFLLPIFNFSEINFIP